ncbi:MULTISPECIES: T9SS sorting signal type C domain-containing protein [Flavobacterium]|uniref:T9SS sorting signal type C domain-containing protein n=1 Tax=Flavobacterium TaxID=237 RepID=UPI002115128E|nr:MULTISPECIES: T9SS sorting signal type C domain-containing protein [Flavobacterium]UUF15350.1 T9SS sorting signal type C domain-containing protein [Flavobacterium panici]
MIRKLLLFVRSLFLLFPNSSKEKSFTLSLRLICLGMFFVVSLANATTYYSPTSGTISPSTLTNWWTNTNSTGSNPANFTTAGDIFIIQNGCTMSTTTAWSITGNLQISTGGILIVNNHAITITGTTSITGTLNLSNNTGAKTFIGLVTVNSGGNWNNSSNVGVTFRGGITNNGTFTTGTGVQTFDTNTQALNGTISIPRLTANIGVSNNGILTVTNTLAGSSSLTNNSGATLNINTTASSGINTITNSGTATINATAAITTVTANFVNTSTGTLNISGSSTINGITNNGTTNLASSGTISTFNNATAASQLNITATTTPITTLTTTVTGNTVNYNGTTQTIFTTTYSNLIVSNSGTKTLGGATIVTSDVNIANTVTLATSNNNLTIGGNFTSSGTFTPGTGTVTLNGANQSFNVPTFYALTFSGSGTKTFASTGATVITNALTINSGINTNLGTQTHTANTLTLGSTLALPGSWGSSSSPATNKSDTYFTATTGQINASTSTCANFSSVLQIINVNLNTLSKTSSGTGGYEDFTADTPTKITQGKSYALTVRGNTGGDQNVYYSAFFDWNNDGDFDDAGEYSQIGTIRNSVGTTADGKAASVYITVPSIVTGDIKMRIIGRLTGYNNTPCAISGSSGQMEDYKVTVQFGCSGTAGAPVSSASTVCPNVPFTISLPSSTLSDGATYVWQTSPDNATWTNATPAPITFFGTEAFNSLPTNTNLYGSATITANQLLLTPATNSLNGAWVIQTIPGTNMDAFTVNFDYQIPSGGTGADGFSLSYAGDITSDAAGGESGQGSGIIVQFDTYDNEGVAAGSRVRVLYAGNVLFNSAIDVPPLRPTTGNTPVVLTVDSKGKLTLRINGSVVVSDLSLPVAYLSTNKSTWKYKFAARTGGSNDNHIIDNLLIRYQDVTNSNSTFSTTQTAKTYYRVQVTCGTTTTTTSVLVDMSTAAITTQPTTPAAVCSGTGVRTISVAATGSGLTYSWRLGGVAATNGGVISGQGTNTLTLTNPTAANAGNYTVVVGDVCTTSVTSNPVTLTVNPTPTLTGASQAAAVCAGSSATINLTGLLASSTSTVSYTINGIAQTPVTGVTATTGGTASFTSAALTAANNGQTLQITGITTTSNTPNCSQSFTTNVTLAVNPSPTLTGASQAAAVCVGSSATINLTGLRASSTFTVSYTINGVAQTSITGLTATAGGTASFTTPALTAANNGQTLQITGITTTSSTPNCSQSFTINVTLAVNPTPTLSGASQAAAVCVGSSATINLTGLLASSTSTVSYTINSVAQTPVTGVTATAGGTASFTTPALTAANNGQTLQITGITTTSSTPNCSQSFTTNVTLAVNPTPTLTGASQAATVCVGSSATINLTGLLASSTSTVSYTINGVAQTPVTGVTATAGGTASFTSAALTAANNGQTLQITGITTTSNTPNCSQSFTTNVTLAVNPSPTLTGASQAAAVCVGSSATINLTGLRASSTFTVSYTINGVAQTSITGLTATAGGTASFTTPALTAANNGQTLQITGITTTSSTPNCSQSFTTNVTLAVNPTPTLSGASQAASVCVGSSATINLTGLLASSTSTVSYTINSVAQTPVTGVTATAGGTASFTTPALTAANNGQVLRITGITTTSSTPNCSQSFTTNVTLAVNPTPTLTGASQAAAVCAGSSATINLTGLLASSTSTVSYTINGVAQTPVTSVTATAGGTASFTTPLLTAANNGQTLQITGITTTSSTPNCSQSFTTNVTLTVNALPTITTHPQAIAVCEGKNHTFTIVTSAGSPSYQWQYSPDNSNWTNTNGAAGVTGHTTALLNVTNIPLSYSGYYVRCIITVGTCSSTSNSALLTVNPTPTAPTASVTTQPTCAVPTATITVSSPAPAAGITYSIDGTTYTNTTGIFTGVATGSSYNVTTKNSSGCESPITVVTVNTYAGKTWNGSVSTNWNVAGNWTPSGVPTVDDCVVIPDLTSIANKPEITGTNIEYKAHSINLNNNSSFIVRSTNTLTVTNAVTVNTGSTLTFENNASLVQTTNAVNSGNITYLRSTTPINRYDYVYWSVPVTATPGITLHDLSPTTLADKYQSFNPTSGWVISYNGTQVMTPGQGYIVRGPQENVSAAVFQASFTGVPNNGDFTITPVATKWHLIGNPYPSAISANKLITDAGTGALYFWTHTNQPDENTTGNETYNYDPDDYSVYTLSGSTGTSNGPAASGKIAAGQGFFFKASTGNNVVFTNSMRIPGENSQFFKTAADIERNRVWLNMSTTTGLFKQVLVGYIDGATNSWDQNYDAATLNGSVYLDFYSLNEAKKLTIQGRGLPFEDTDLVPLGYRTAVAGEFTIAIDHTDGLLNDQAVYLEDKVTSKVHDLKVGNYKFTTEIGTFTDRFVLRYTNKTLGTGDFENVKDGLLVSVKDKAIKVTSSKENIKEVSVFDITGKLLYNKKKVETTEFSISNLQAAEQVLLVKVTLENKAEVTRKIIFK